MDSKTFRQPVFSDRPIVAFLVKLASKKAFPQTSEWCRVTHLTHIVFLPLRPLFRSLERRGEGKLYQAATAVLNDWIKRLGRPVHNHRLLTEQTPKQAGKPGALPPF